MLSSSKDHRELERACEENDIARVHELLTTRRSLNQRDATSCSLRTPDLPLMRCLLEHGADLRWYLLNNAPPSLDMIKLFVEFGYDVKAEGHKIIRDFAHDQETLDWLLDHGADINQTNENRDGEGVNRHTGWHDFSLKVLNVVATNGDIQMFDHLVSRGANPHRSMALHRASKCQDARKSIAMIDHLLDKYHMDIEANNDDMRDKIDHSHDSGSPINCAVYYLNLAAVNHLPKRGAKPSDAAHQSAGRRWGATATEPFLPALGPCVDRAQQ